MLLATLGQISKTCAETMPRPSQRCLVHFHRITLQVWHILGGTIRKTKDRKTNKLETFIMVSFKHKSYLRWYSLNAGYVSTHPFPCSCLLHCSISGKQLVNSISLIRGVKGQRCVDGLDLCLQGCSNNRETHGWKQLKIPMNSSLKAQGLLLNQ